MGGSANLLGVAALLERAYRMALVLREMRVRDGGISASFVAAELIEVLDEARIALLDADDVAHRVSSGSAAGTRR